MQRFLAAYEFARKWVRGKFVLDAGCGWGYGADYLSCDAQRVIGIDYSKRCIDSAKRRYRRGNIEFICSDLLNVPFSNNTFDVICSFQTIEHIKSYERYLIELKRLLKPDGLLILSTPNKEMCIAGLAPFHAKEFSCEEFGRLLRAFFSEVTLLELSADEAFMKIKKRERFLGKVILRLDIFKLHKKLPRKILEFLYMFILSLSNKFTRLTHSNISIKNFIATDKNIINSIDMIALCKK